MPPQFTLVILLLLLLVQPLAAAGKLGLCCLGCTPTTYEPFANATSWVYRYSLFVDDADAAEWLVKHEVEFVPHLAHKRVPLPNGTACNFDVATKNVPLCTDAMLDSALAVNAKGLKINYMMGWNEAYDRGSKKAQKKYIAPGTAATYWRTMVQRMAKRANVKLVSPTTGVEPQKLEWLGNMLVACWSQRGLSPGCDVETVAAFSVHDYKCGEQYWRSNYGTNGIFQTKLKRFLSSTAAGRGKDWATFVDTRSIWGQKPTATATMVFLQKRKLAEVSSALESLVSARARSVGNTGYVARDRSQRWNLWTL